MRHLFGNKAFVLLFILLWAPLGGQAQVFVDFLQENKNDSIKIKKYLKSNVTLKDEYKNVLLCSCINEFQKFSIIKSGDSCIQEIDDIGHLVFDEIIYSRNLKSLHNPTLLSNIELFNSQILLPDIRKMQSNDEYGVIQISVLSHCKKIITKTSNKYYQLLLRSPIKILIPWLYK